MSAVSKAASKAAAAAVTQQQQTSSLSNAGKAFFGSLCASTFALGCWQTSRLLERQTLIAKRAEEIEQEPTSSRVHPGTFRRILVEGEFDHSKEILVGPRGAPSTVGGVGGGGGGMPSSQGYYVVTPLRTVNGQVLWVNRGWVPRSFVVPTSRMRQPPSQRPQQRQDSNDAAAASSSSRMLQWSRPTGITQLLAIPATPEQPKFLVAQHNFKDRPIQLYWFDVDTMRQLIQCDDAHIVTQVIVNNDNDDNNNKDDKEKKDDVARHNTQVLYPQPASLQSLQEFKVSPAVHAAYAFTWFSLSLAGLIMTRRLARMPPVAVPVAQQVVGGQQVSSPPPPSSAASTASSSTILSPRRGV